MRKKWLLTEKREPLIKPPPNTGTHVVEPNQAKLCPCTGMQGPEGAQGIITQCRGEGAPEEALAALP